MAASFSFGSEMDSAALSADSNFPDSSFESIALLRASEDFCNRAFAVT